LETHPAICCKKLYYNPVDISLWRRLRKQGIRDLPVSPDIRMFNSRKMRWVGHVACMEEMINNTKFWSRNVKGSYYSEDVGEIGICQNGS
jgi:hypothetical protein